MIQQLFSRKESERSGSRPQKRSGNQSRLLARRYLTRIWLVLTDKFKWFWTLLGDTPEVYGMSIQSKRAEPEHEAPPIDTRRYSRGEITFYEVGETSAWIEASEDAVVEVER
jgi:hypothetical protein